MVGSLDTPPSIPENRSLIKEGQKWPKHCPAKPYAATLSRAKRLEDSNRHFPPTDLSIRDSCHQSQARFGTLVHQICLLTVPWEDMVEEAYKLKELHCAELAAEAVWLEHQYVPSGRWM